MTAGALLEFHGFYVIFSAVIVLEVACATIAVRYLKTSEQVAAARMEAEDINVGPCQSEAVASDAVKPDSEKMKQQAEVSVHNLQVSRCSKLNSFACFNCFSHHLLSSC